MTNSAELYVRSHVARDLQQSAALFKTDSVVVWEYVSNSLQYIDPGRAPEVHVRIDPRRKSISITDNGAGMDWAALKNFFVMHGENQERRAGRSGRGRFGTGKSAAFGIARLLRVTTVREGKRSKVELALDDIDTMKSSDGIPVRVLENEAACSDPNGTVVEIEDIQLRKIRKKGVIAYIERHLARWAPGVTVIVNSHECERYDPPIDREKRFTPEGDLSEVLAGCELVVRVSKAPLENDLRGIGIFSKGVWYETTLGGNEGRDMVQYIFGEFDVPQLDDDDHPIAAVDMSRSMKLNTENPLVQAIHSFVGRSVDEVRRELVKAEKQERDAEQARRLQKEAQAIAQIINEDFKDFRDQITKVKAQAPGSTDLSGTPSPEETEADDFLRGGDSPADVDDGDGGPPTDRGGKGGEGGTKSGSDAPELGPGVKPSDNGRQSGTPAPKKRKQARRGGFDVKFEGIGEDENRALYHDEQRVIFINLDHPQIRTALGQRQVEDPVFRRLAYEVAFSEYAIALARLQAIAGYHLDPDDALYDVRVTLDRVSRRAASLYAE